MSGGVPAGELLPCPNPWCERIEGVEASRHLVTERWHVCCDDCMIEGPWAKTYDEAVAAWNTRAVLTPPIEGRDADVERDVRVILQAVADADSEDCIGSIDVDIPKGGYPRQWLREAARAALQALGERG